MNFKAHLKLTASLLDIMGKIKKKNKENLQDNIMWLLGFWPKKHFGVKWMFQPQNKAK